MSDINAAASGQFTLGDISVNRLGFGAMRIVGDGVWGEPTDREEVLRTLRRVPELGVNFIDTADSYGPNISERLIREALHPYDGLLIATKGGFPRQGPNRWAAVGRPEYLRQAVLISMRDLNVERIDLWQLHRVDPKVPEDEQFGVIADMRREGLIRHVGLSEVNIDQIKTARRFFPVVSVQNKFNLTDRTHEAVLDYCSTEGIGFIPWAPLSRGNLAKPGSLLDTLTKQSGHSPSQIALAWMLQRSPVMLPIPGTGKVRHLEQNVAASSVRLSAEEFAQLDQEGRAASSRPR
jgi:pyridoxine 4-dehydrogenase